MAINLYSHERCSDCGEIRHALKDRNVDFTDGHFPPADSDIDALSGNIPEPVLIDDERAPDGIVGHEEVLGWIRENYS